MVKASIKGANDSKYRNAGCCCFLPEELKFTGLPDPFLHTLQTEATCTVPSGTRTRAWQNESTEQRTALRHISFFRSFYLAFN